MDKLAILEQSGKKLEGEEMLRAMLGMTPDYFILVKKELLRPALRNLAKSINPDGEDQETVLNGEKITFGWDGVDIPQTLQMEGVQNGATRTITLPLVDWQEDLPMSTIDFSYSANNDTLTIHNTSGLDPANLSKADVQKAVEGTKWLIMNLLEWKESKLVNSTTSLLK